MDRCSKRCIITCAHQAYSASILAAIRREVCSFTPTEQSEPPGVTLNFISGCYETAKKKNQIHNLFLSVTALIQVTLQLFLLQLVTVLKFTFRKAAGGKKKKVSTLPKSCLTHLLNQPRNLPGAIKARLGKVGAAGWLGVEKDTVGTWHPGLVQESLALQLCIGYKLKGV